MVTFWVKYGLFALAVSSTAVRWNPPTDNLPAYYTGAPHTRPDHTLLSGDQLTGQYFSHPYQVMAYQMAAKVEAVLYQQPCYCRCDIALHHKSLHSCFEGTHGAVCATCMRQAVYTYQQTKLGKSPQQIREGIEQGEWRDVDVQSATF